MLKFRQIIDKAWPAYFYRTFVIGAMLFKINLEMIIGRGTEEGIQDIKRY
jgi:hypothetical protein